ncbi:hypothetical protein [Actinoplanes derwentensis]|uniref:PemK-like, MazF-like toxin of type II toxin-antitoxin system n=1 Tax=Actinoplanes derwentensis TaxID=113562 RepID=A0A1H2C9K7_9ACTN|nr:hypothetical protein [Actinoplanes derwentensis]GID86517.1 hypothetical protein Ade03nite_54410 [Actinoplanes derwentensis]SDT66746.1 hypothetical protein SAMN04489716_5383 [Actinoplanes derwentensis]
MDLLTGTTALAMITALIVGVLLWVIARDPVRAFLRPIGPVVAVLAVVLYGVAALLMAAPVDLLIGEPSAADVWVTLLGAPAVALLMGSRFRPRRTSATLTRALLLLAGCSGARYLAHLAGFPVDGFWTAAAISFAGLALVVTAFEFLRRPGVTHLVVRAFVVLSLAGLVAAWAQTNRVPLYANPRTASPETLWVMLLVEPLGALAAILLLIAALRHFAPGTLPRADSARTPAAGEIWNAFVTYEDDSSEGKDRPVLVLSGGHSGQATILRITSQDKTRFPDYLPLPHSRCRPVLTKDSWLNLKPVPLAADAFRSYRGRSPAWLTTELAKHDLLPPTTPSRLRSWLFPTRVRS